MKNYLKSLLLAAMAVAVTACSLDKIGGDSEIDNNLNGYLQISSVSVNSDTETAIIGSKSASVTRATAEADGDFYIEVINTKTSDVAWSGNYSQLRNGNAPVNIELEGRETYKVYAYQDENMTPAADVVSDEPYYTGVSSEVYVEPNMSSSASVVCTMANVKASVELSADMKTSFKTYDSDNADKNLKTVVSVGAASHIFTVDDTHSSTQKYFPLNGEDNTMYIVLSGTYYTGRFEDLLNGNVDESLWKDVEMKKTLTVNAAQWHKISVDIDHNTAGNAEFSFTIESYTYDDEIEVDVVTLYESALMYEETMLDDELDLTAPIISIDGRRDLNYTVNASMIDPDTDSWNSFLKLKITPASGATVQQVWARLQNTTSRTLRSAMENKGFADGRVNIYGPKDAAVDAYSTVSADGKTITTKSTGMSAIYNYSGTHTFRVYAIDSAGGGSKGYAGDIVITVTADAGQGPTIEWLRDMDDDGEKENVIDMVHDLTAANCNGYDTELSIKSETGVTSLYVVMVAAPLTANNNEALGLLGLSDEMDLMEPADVAMETGLRQIGLLPTADGVSADEDDEYRIYDPVTGLRKKNSDGSDKLSPFYGQLEVPFSVTEFTGTLWNFYSKSGPAEFILTAGHDGGTTEKSVVFNIVK